MDIQSDFEAFIKKEGLCQPGDRIILAVSGGMDSMLMLHLFAGVGYEFAVAHCNFSLRGEDSDRDEQLVREVSERLALPFYVRTFDTEGYAQSHGISIQMAARDLRYDWLEDLRQAEDYDYIAVAHHLNDSMETALFNWVRGTGLAGMRGILPKRGRVIRPLLFATREKIVQAVAHYGVDYRDDKSNYATKYARNKIRLEVIPALKQINPSLEHGFAEHTFLFSESLELVEAHVAKIRAEIVDEYDFGRFRICRKAIANLNPQRLLLAELLRPFGFSISATTELASLSGSASGKEISSDRYTVHIDREYIFILPHNTNIGVEDVSIEGADTSVKWGGYEFSITVSTDTTIKRGRHVAQFDADMLSFPLRIRSWKLADTFYPLGMGRRKKKLSDYFVSMKIPVFEKESVPILANAKDQIAWVVPYRMDDRFKITEKTKKVITLTCLPVA